MSNDSPFRNKSVSAAVVTAMRAADEEAISWGHDYVGTEHILLGLAKEPSIAATLQRFGVTLDALRAKCEESVRRGRFPRPSGELPFTSRAKMVLDFADAEARQSSEAQVKPEHLLIGLLREDHSIACEVLNQLGVTLEKVRAGGADAT